MGVNTAATSTAFAEFVQSSEPRLRRALVATYGPVIGRDATVDSLSWAWEHWDRLAPMDNPVGYLYRVGQTAAGRHMGGRPLELQSVDSVDAPDSLPDLAPALAQLSEQQRAVVVLVHGYGMSQREVAELLGIAVSTAREHLARGMARLREQLEDDDEH
ncbi:MAG: putative polymerase subfamily sigma factor [Ilumatobacteraceae bacterium]|nr:putative polymerase subfamily sigma factor [Ilumatobacteraceae bacterium]